MKNQIASRHEGNELDKRIRNAGMGGNTWLNGFFDGYGVTINPDFRRKAEAYNKEHNKLDAGFMEIIKNDIMGDVDNTDNKISYDVMGLTATARTLFEQICEEINKGKKTGQIRKIIIGNLNVEVSHQRKKMQNRKRVIEENYAVVMGLDAMSVREKLNEIINYFHESDIYRNIRKEIIGGLCNGASKSINNVLKRDDISSKQLKEIIFHIISSRVLDYVFFVPQHLEDPEGVGESIKNYSEGIVGFVRRNIKGLVIGMALIGAVAVGLTVYSHYEKAPQENSSENKSSVLHIDGLKSKKIAVLEKMSGINLDNITDDNITAVGKLVNLDETFEDIDHTVFVKIDNVLLGKVKAVTSSINIGTFKNKFTIITIAFLLGEIDQPKYKVLMKMYGLDAQVELFDKMTEKKERLNN